MKRRGRFQAVRSGGDGQLRGEVIADADRGELGGGDRSAVQGDSAHGRLGGDDVDVVYVKTGQRGGQRIAVQELLDRRHQQQGGVTEHAVIRGAVGELGQQDRLAGVDLGWLRQYRLVKLTAVQRGDRRPVYADLGCVPRGEDPKQVAAAPRGQRHGHELPAPRVHRRQLFHQIVGGVVPGRDLGRPMPAVDADRLVGRDLRAGQVGHGAGGQFVYLSGVQADRVRHVGRVRADGDRRRDGRGRPVLGGHQAERRRASGLGVAFAVGHHQVLQPERIAGQRQVAVGAVRQVAEGVHSHFLQGPHAHAPRFHLVAARDLGRVGQHDPRDLARADRKGRHPRALAGDHYGAGRIHVAGNLQTQLDIPVAQHVAVVPRKAEPEVGATAVRRAQLRCGDLLDLEPERPEVVADRVADRLVAGRDQRVRARLGQHGRQLVARLPLEHETARRPLQVKIDLLRVVDQIDQQLFAGCSVELVADAVHGRGGLAADGRVQRDRLHAVRRHVPDLELVAAGLVAVAVDAERIGAGLREGQRPPVQAVVGKSGPRVHGRAGRIQQPRFQDHVAGRLLEIDVDRLAGRDLELPMVAHARSGNEALIDVADPGLEDRRRRHIPEPETVRTQARIGGSDLQRVRPGRQV